MRPKVAVNLIVVAILISILHSISMAGTNMKYANYISHIKKMLPDGWKVLKENSGVIPDGHYFGMEYKGQKGVSLLIIGEKAVNFEWKDKEGNWHKDPIAKESLEIWFMPPHYSQSWKRFFVFHRPVPAESIIGTQDVRIFGKAGHVITDKEAFHKILSNAKSTKWTESLANRGSLSWLSWKKDIENAISIN